MYAVSITEDQLFDAIGTWLAPFAGSVAGCTVFKSQGNDVPPPPDPAIELTPVLRVSLNTPVSTYDGTATQLVEESIRMDVQADFKGPGMGDLARAVKSAWRSIWGVDAASTLDFTPLYCSDEVQAPFITGERQYQECWTVTLSLQYNAIVSLPQSFFSIAVKPTAIAADIFQPVP